jgi:hypothetical protein
MTAPMPILTTLIILMTSRITIEVIGGTPLVGTTSGVQVVLDAEPDLDDALLWVRPACQALIHARSQIKDKRAPSFKDKPSAMVLRWSSPCAQ